MIANIIILLILLYFSYSLFIKPFYSVLIENKNFQEYMKTSRIITTFISSDEYDKMQETKKNKLTHQYLG